MIVCACMCACVCVRLIVHGKAHLKLSPFFSNVLFFLVLWRTA